MNEPPTQEQFPGAHTDPEDLTPLLGGLIGNTDVAGELQFLMDAYTAAMERIDPGGKKAERDELCRTELRGLAEAIEHDPGDAALPQRVLGVIEKYGFRFEQKLEPSPIFPDGRDGSISFRDVLARNKGKYPRGFWDNTKAGNVYVPDTVRLFLETTEMLPPEEYLEPSSTIRFAPNPELYRRNYADLRAEFGAKAANLIVFDAALRGDDTLTRDAFGRGPIIQVPPFLPVSKQLHALWRTDYSAFALECERVREQMLRLPYDDSPLFRTWMVAIRSSAVKSEDGDEHSAAGIYHSGAADVRDRDAFRGEVEKVFASVTSEHALLYQQEAGVEDEEMGLLVQLYSEEFVTPHDHYEGVGVRNGYYGHANYVLGGRAIDVQIAGAGSLLYDAPNRGDGIRRPWPGYSDLHSDPDHNSLEYLATKKARAIPYAVALATYLFGKPMEVEFHNSNIVQVRPYIENNTQEVVQFPINKRELVSTRSVGVIDAQLSFLNGDEDNRDKTGYIVIEKEFCFTASGNYEGFPKSGAVILLRPSDGHVQAYCRERGLTCLFPRRYNGHDYILPGIQEDDEDGKPRAKSVLHIVSDGFEARVYDADIE